MNIRRRIKSGKLNFIKILNFNTWKHLFSYIFLNKSIDERKCLPVMYVIRSLDPECNRASHNSAKPKKALCVFLQKYTLVSELAERCLVSWGRGKSKPQRNTSSYPPVRREEADLERALVDSNNHGILHYRTPVAWSPSRVGWGRTPGTPGQDWMKWRAQPPPSFLALYSVLTEGWRIHLWQRVPH